MHSSRRSFIQKAGLSALSLLPGAAIVRAMAKHRPLHPKSKKWKFVRRSPSQRNTRLMPILPIMVLDSVGELPSRLMMVLPPPRPLVLEELRKRNLKATFFMLGQMVKAHPEIAKEVLAAGHEIGNHSYTHPQLGKMPQAKVEEELRSAEEAIVAATGFTPVWFRPPYGSFRKDQGSIALAQQLGVIYWSVDPNDWKKPGINVVVDRVLTETRPGSVILLHDIHKTTCEAVPAILDGLLDRGFEFTNVSGFSDYPTKHRKGTEKESNRHWFLCLSLYFLDKDGYREKNLYGGSH